MQTCAQPVNDMMAYFPGKYSGGKIVPCSDLRVGTTGKVTSVRKDIYRMAKWKFNEKLNFTSDSEIILQFFIVYPFHNIPLVSSYSQPIVLACIL
jgi:hypothetical protein